MALILAVVHTVFCKPHPFSTGRVGIRWGFDQSGSQIPHPGDESLGQIPYISPPYEVGIRRDLTPEHSTYRLSWILKNSGKMTFP